ncbi:HHL061Wp [Eremothecium sinecaudum]|uniref:HHL061Wp n=1 Tax=Eremothecium sinecaudum TaxID=45286 RepID=A0A0X8HWB0_9SACH|nr:HHL061Wp [Eremothecium sinecaudum]AMD22709.1 HHL061Wp [Eremothecium sinecaudum]
MQLSVLIAGWYLSSIGISLYNKLLFDPYKGLKVPYPIFITSLHQFLLWALTFVYLKAKNQFPRDGKADWYLYAKYIIPTALASAGDIGFANVSLKYIPLTIYTIVKTSGIAFVLLFGCICKLEQFTIPLGLVVFFMFAGVLLMIYRPEDTLTEHSSQEQILGFFLVLASSCLSGLRWVYTQLTLLKSTEFSGTQSRSKKGNPILTIYQLAPIMGFALLFTSLIIESPFPGIANTSIAVWENHSTTMVLVRGISMLLFPGLCVFLMTLCEFAILQTAPVLTLSVAGVVKELLTVILSMLILHEVLSFYNWIGMTVVMLDVCFYNYYRYMEDTFTSKSFLPLDNDIDRALELEQLNSAAADHLVTTPSTASSGNK